MKRLMTGVVAAAMLVPALTACGGDEASDFCDQQVNADINMDDPEAAKAALQDAVDDAPDEIKDDLQLVVDALDDMEGGNIEDVDMDALTEASTNITTWTTENCS